MNNDKLDAMMKLYCNRDIEPFEFKEKKSILKSTSLIAAVLVIVFLAVIILYPKQAPTKEKGGNSFTLTASAAEINYSEDYAVEEIFSVTPFVIKGENIQKISAYSKYGYTSIAFGATKNYNMTDKYHYENFPHSDDLPDPLFVVPYVKDENGKLVEADLSTDLARNTPYTYVEVVDENDKPNKKHIPVICLPIDENKEYLLPEGFSSKYNDTIVVEVTFSNGEKQTKYATIAYEGGKIKFDTTP